MDSVAVRAYAKINLFLEVGKRRDDGYHDLESVMQSVDLSDSVKITRTDTSDIEINCTMESLPTDETNLVYKAAVAFFKNTGMENCGVRFDIEKHIPVGAGLAGGSADAAATLVGLNELFETGLDEDELCAIGKSIGADVPFCIKKGTCLARGIGEILDRIEPMPECAVVIALGSERISTKWAFEQLDLRVDRKIKKIDGFLSALKTRNIPKITEQMYNVFETVSPHKQRIKEILSKYNLNKSLMSGSGPSIFSLFTDKTQAQAAYSALKAEEYEVFICSMLNF